MGYIKKAPKFSYSKLNVFDSCGFKYKLTYVDGHYIFTDSLASELGTTLHFIEETIARTLKDGKAVDYDKLKDDFLNINIPKKDKYDLDGGIFGVNILKNKYKEEFYATDDQGKSYYTKCLDYLTYGIYRLEKYLKENPNLVVFDMEKFFSIEFQGNILSGYIDRIFYDKENDVYIIEDIKTKGKPFKDDELVTPLQFVIYAIALCDNLDLSPDQIKCAYDLPFLDKKQAAGTPGFIKRGTKKLEQIFSGISKEDYSPKPTPLCHWCQYCATNEDAPEEGKHLCPYHSLWTRENKTHNVANKWRGLNKHEELMKKLEEEQSKTPAVQDSDIDFDF